MSFPRLITVNAMAVPHEHWELPRTHIHNMAVVYPHEECTCCGGKIRNHIWFVLSGETTVSDCSGAPR